MCILLRDVPLRVSHSACIPLRVNPIPCVFHSICIQLRMCSMLISHSVGIPLRGYPTPCKSHSICVFYSVCPTPCIPIRVYCTPFVFHSVCVPPRLSHSVYPTPYVFHSMYIPFCAYPIPCASNSVCIQLRVYSTLISYSMRIPLRASHFVCVSLLYLTPCVSLHVSHVPIHVSHVPIHVSQFLYVLLYVSHSSYIQRKSELYIQLLVCPTPCVSHSLCPTSYSFYISLRIGPTSREFHFLSMCSTPCVSVYRPLFVFVR